MLILLFIEVGINIYGAKEKGKRGVNHLTGRQAPQGIQGLLKVF